MDGTTGLPVGLHISSITEIELFGYPNLTAEEETQITNVLSSLAIIAVDSRIAGIAGFIRRTYKLKVSDSAIAATALFTGSTLLTRNVKDFKRIPELALQKI